jgi:hypothetical protein
LAKVRIVRSDAGQHHRFAARGSIAPERLDLDVDSARWKAGLERAYLGVDFGDPRERLGDCTRGFSVVADDQLSRFLGELLRSRQIGGLGVTGCCVEVSSSPRNPGMLISRRAVSSAVLAMSAVRRSVRGGSVRVSRRIEWSGSSRGRSLLLAERDLGSGGVIVNAKFVRAGTLADLNAKGRFVIRGSHRPILVVKDQGRVYAFDNRCPHMGFPSIAEAWRTAS